MKKVKLAGKILFLFFAVTALSACNKGVGCPMEFSADALSLTNLIFSIF